MDLKSLRNQYEQEKNGVLVADHKGRILYLNPAAFPFAGRAGQSPLPSSALTGGNHGGSLFYHALSRALSSKRKVSLLEKGPEDIHYLVTASPVLDPGGKIQYVLCFCAEAGQYPGIDGSSQLSWEDSHPFKKTVQGSPDIENFNFASPAMRKVMQKVEKTAQYDATVILLGESGVGKNIIANLIHSLSDRKDKPFIYINCGAIPANLLESELFGYEKGAFTGATASHTGLIERAQSGTLFFDEVAELPLAMQAKILHFLNEKFIYKISGKKPIHIDARVISATNKNLPQLIEKGLFREDLYYRLNVLKVEIPPLRERREDLMILIKHYFTYFNNKYCLYKTLSNEAYQYLLNYHWPGNIRELRNIIEQLVILSERDMISLEDFPPEIARPEIPRPEIPRRPEALSTALAPASPGGDPKINPIPALLTPGLEALAAGSSLALDDLMDQYESLIFNQLYEKYSSSYKIAKLLKISQTKANRKLQKYCRLPQKPQEPQEQL